jgi:hypothetical protein
VGLNQQRGHCERRRERTKRHKLRVCQRSGANRRPKQRFTVVRDSQKNDPSFTTGGKLAYLG